MGSHKEPVDTGHFIVFGERIKMSNWTFLSDCAENENKNKTSGMPIYIIYKKLIIFHPTSILIS